MTRDYGDTSFRSFISLVLNSSSIDNRRSENVHWRPYYVRCAYCQAHFDVVGKLENFDEDFKYIVEKV